MRANGVDERYSTGDARPEEKFQAWARTVPYTLRNPLYHWTHLELKRYFGIDELLDESSARRIWDRANELLATGDLRVHGIFRKFHVRALCTTDDPTDDLACHRAIAASRLATRVLPAFRPDKALNVHQPQAYNAWLDKLAAVSNIDIRRVGDMLDALRKRHDAFHELGGRLSDHGLNHAYARPCSDEAAERIFENVRAGRAATPDEQVQFASYMMLFFGRLDAEKGWTKQLHLGARRNNSTRGFERLGADTGYDSMGDNAQIDHLGAYLDLLEREDALPKVILYNVNPQDNYALATMAGNFGAKVRYGAAWWFMDQKEGMEWQMNALSNVGLLSRFLGMLTDSRSFMSYPRHEYFRRTLCNLVGRDVENGEVPEELAGPMIRRICYANALEFLGLQ
jgi:glucuronate isomerase